MRLYSPFDLTGNLNMIEKLVLGGIETALWEFRTRIIIVLHNEHLVPSLVIFI